MTFPAMQLDTALDLFVRPKLQRSAKRLSLSAQRRLSLLILVVVDALALSLALVLAYWIRFHAAAPVFDATIPDPSFYMRLSLSLIPLWLALFWAYRLYDWETLLGGLREYAAVFQAAIAGAIVIAMAQFILEEMSVARGWVGLTSGLVFLLVALCRLALRRVAYAARRRGYLMTNTLIVGSNDEARLLGQQLQAWPTSGLNMLGFVAASNGEPQAYPGSRLAGSCYVLGSLDQLDTLIRRYNVAELILATSALGRETMLDIFRTYGASPTVHLRLSSGLFEILTTGLQVKEFASVPLIDVNRVRLSGIDVVIKRFIDVTLSLVGLLCLAPVFIAIAMRIKRDSPGPVFHRRRVMGLNGRQFDALKFRTMVVNGNAVLAAHPELARQLAANHKLKDDPRITRIGRILRKYSLDELPQLFNVLIGDMSLVGPRIIAPVELKQYDQWGMNLLTVRPGLTGLWQVSGRSDVTYAERVHLDMQYIRNYSIWLDCHIIWRTIPVVFMGRGAY